MEIDLNKSGILKKIIGLLKPYINKIMIVFICLLLSSFLNFCIPIINKKIMDDGFVNKNFNCIITLSILLFFFYLVNEALNYLKQRERVNISNSIHYDLIASFYKHINKIKIKYLNDMNKSEILNNLSIDIENILLVADEGVIFIISQLFNIIGGLIGLCIIDYHLLIVVILFIPLKVITILYLSNKRQKVVEDYIENNKNYIHEFSDTINGIKEIRLFGIQLYREKEFSFLAKIMTDSKGRLDLIGQVNLIVDNILVQLLNMLIYIIGAYYVFKTGLSIGSVFAFITYSVYVTSPITVILNTRYIFAGIMPSAERYFKFMDLEEESADYSIQNVGSVCNITFENVSFSYTNVCIIKKANFYIKAMEKIALIGENGAGKTTIINLLLRLITPTEGKICINNNDIQLFKLETYRECFSVVSQDLFLFNKSIKENIILNQKVNQQQLNKVIKESGLEEFVSKVTLEYKVGDNGCMLSGGQKQKIALARALLSNKQIIIFDEATSSIDAISEELIRNLMKTTLKYKTVLFITHNFKLLDMADRILTIKDGTIKEEVKHENL